MHITRRHALIAGATTLVSPMMPAHSRDMAKIIVPLPAGTGADAVARLLAHGLENIANEPLSAMIENRPGALGTTATAKFAQEQNDGKTFLMALTSTFSGARHLFNNVGYDQLKDFTPLSLVATFCFVLLVNRDLGVKNLKDFIDQIKKNADTYTYGYGNAIGRVLAEQLCFSAGTKARGAPYRGENQLLPDLLANRIQWAFASSTVAVDQVRSKAIIAPAVGTARRSLLLPDIPTMQEAGLETFIALQSWSGLVGKDLTDSTAEKWSRSVREALSIDVVKERLHLADVEPIGSTPEQMGAFLHDQSEKWDAVVPHLGIAKM